MRTIEEFLDRVPEKNLHHYTNAKGLLGILDSGKIWASSAYHLNDSGEFRYALGLITDRLSERLSGEHGLNNERYGALLDQFKLLPDSVQPYVASFSEEGDLLSQWLAYPRAQNGFAVGFAPAQFDFAKREGFRLVPCVYDRNEQNELVEAIIKVLLDVVADSDAALDQVTKDALASKALIAAAALKHPGFEREVEWRLVKTLAVGFGVSKGVLFREGRSGVVPYLCAPLVTEGEQMKPKVICIGPNDDVSAAKVAVATLLDARGLGQRLFRIVDVECSKTPYRP
jgi:Protein of unknown function (DUF2971)